MSIEERVDAHHHIWWLDRTPWLAGPPVPRIFGEYDAIRRDYPLAEYAADAAAGNVAASVYVQVNVAAEDRAAEVGWVGEAGAGSPLVGAIVAQADLAAPDLPALLDRQCAAGPVRGVRQQLHWHPNPAYRFADRPDLMSAPAWRAGLKHLAQRGLLFEAQVFPHQYDAMLEAIDAAPDVTFVLLHAGMPQDDSPAGRRAWLDGLRRFARRDNVFVKLSALGTFIRRCDSTDWRPVVEATIDAFGPQRCMFGSNFPVEKLWTSYQQLVDVFDTCIAGYTPAERRAILMDVATGLYLVPGPHECIDGSR